MNTYLHKVVEALGMLTELREGGRKQNYDAFLSLCYSFPTYVSPPHCIFLNVDMMYLLRFKVYMAPKPRIMN